MSNEALIKQIDTWHIAGEHDKIMEAILALPEQERSDELTCLLARALNNEEDYAGALKVLDGIWSSDSDHPLFCVRYAIALYGLHREHEALEWFQKAQAKGIEEIDEMPGTYYPVSVAKWITFAQRKAPRRIEKNKFEAERRAKRNKEPQQSSLIESTDFEGFWNECEYSQEKYVGKTPTDVDIAEAEKALGYRLPESYKKLIKLHNGGLVQKNLSENPLQRDWTPSTIEVDGIYGISDQAYSLCGTMGSRFWIEEWGYPDIGVAICDCPSGGHDMIFLDYSDCGPEGEPCVVHIDQESDYEITYLADNFEDFVKGLYCDCDDL